MNNMPVIEANVETTDLHENKYLTFNIDQEEYGIAIQYVIQIFGMQKITSIPDLPEFIKGVINLRGKVIPLIDIRLRFGLEPKSYTERTCIIVIQYEELSFGLIVDNVQDVLEVPENKIEQLTSLNQKSENRFVHGFGKIGDQVKILLDMQQILFEEDLQLLENALNEPAEQ